MSVGQWWGSMKIGQGSSERVDIYSVFLIFSFRDLFEGEGVLKINTDVCRTESGVSEFFSSFLKGSNSFQHKRQLSNMD